MGGKVSVIVPVYNVEQYLDQCIQSIVGQTYNDLEIILIDDGSTDGSGSMCDLWAQKDRRIRSAHQKNGGSSCARKKGLRICTGEYVLFVDSDDWIEADMVEVLMEALAEYEADVAVCRIMKHTLDGEIKYYSMGGNRLYTSTKAVYEAILDKDLNNFSVDMICSKRIYDSLEYPSERVKFEDLLFTYKIFEAATKIVHVDKPLYHYMRREDSTLGSWGLNDALMFVSAHQRRAEDLLGTRPEFERVLLTCYYRTLRDARKYLAASDDATIRKHANLLKKNLLPFYRNHHREIRDVNKVSLRNDLANYFSLRWPLSFKRLRKVLR